jgi:hypothetical protein
MVEETLPMVVDMKMLAEKQRPWSKTRKCWQRSKDHDRRHENVSRKTKTLVDVPDTKAFAFKLLSEGLSALSLPYNNRLWGRDDFQRTKPIGKASKTIGADLQQMSLTVYKYI